MSMSLDMSMEAINIDAVSAAPKRIPLKNILPGRDATYRDRMQY